MHNSPYYGAMFSLMRISLLSFCAIILLLLFSCTSTEQTYIDQNHQRQENIWLVLHNDFALNHHTEQRSVQQQIHWFITHKSYLVRVANNGAPYIYYLRQQVQQRHMPTEFVLLPIVESAFNPFNYSRVGAAGIWQFMPGTASGLSVQQDWWYDGRRDVFASTRAALDYLSFLHHYFDGDWLLAVAAYDSGQGTVENAIKHNKRLGLPTDFWHLKLPSETRAYVPRFLGLCAVLNDPEKYKVDWPKTPNKPYFKVIQVTSQLNLSKAAELAGISLAELHELNPGFNRWASDPNGPKRIIVPAEKAELFKKKLAALPQDSRVTWKHYVVRSGDSISRIAVRFDTTRNLIRQTNDLKSDYLYPGQSLLIPSGVTELSPKLIHSVRHYLNNSPVLPGPKQITYIVKQHDTLSGIARRYDVKSRDILFWNQLRSHTLLTPGTHLIIWSHHGISHAAQHAASIRPYVLIHTVKRGESLGLIAHQYGVTIEQIEQANHLKNNVIRLGQRLIIPPSTQQHGKHSHHSPSRQTYLVKNGDSLWKIAHQHNVSEQQLREWNNLPDKLTLHPGQKLVIYR